MRLSISLGIVCRKKVLPRENNTQGNSASEKTPYVCNIGLMLDTQSDSLCRAGGAKPCRLAEGGGPVEKDYHLILVPEIEPQSLLPLQLQRKIMAGSLASG